MHCGFYTSIGCFVRITCRLTNSSGCPCTWMSEMTCSSQMNGSMTCDYMCEGKYVPTKHVDRQFETASHHHLRVRLTLPGRPCGAQKNAELSPIVFFFNGFEVRCSRTTLYPVLVCSTSQLFLRWHCLCAVGRGP